MKVTVNWLKQYVNFDWSPEELAERLTMLGMEVEAIETIHPGLEGVVVAQVLTKEKHPNADKLSLCRVFDGKTERQIVCGATNFQAGDKAALILPGYSLPAKPGEKPFTIKAAKIRGVESHGMLCSEKELGLSEEAAGIIVLPPDAPVGQPFAEYLGRGEADTVLDLEITPNRPDLNSMIGVAREIAALTGNPLRMPRVEIGERREGPAADLVAVRLEAPDLCPRYTARLVRGVQVGPSPDWLRRALEKVGLRSINNVVDVTNYVMLETGQPLHAFDFQLIARGEDGRRTIVVRRARPGERFTTLDEQEHELTEEMLLIADPEKAVALAGVMGGANSEIREATEEVLIESACFHGPTIRRTARKLGLHTDASYRFERGVDIEMVDWAGRRCAQLILEAAGGSMVEGVTDAYPNPQPRRRIVLRHRKVNELLGVSLPPAQIESYLSQLGLRIVDRKPRPLDAPPAPPEPVTLEIPSYRLDLKREADLIEEVCRLHGVDRIPATPPRGAFGDHPYDAVHDQIQEARRLLSGLGLTEAQGQTLIGREAAALTCPESELISLERPLSQDMDVLRPSLLPGLLEILRHNISRKNTDIALFEIGKAFRRGENGPVETRRVGIALTGRRAPLFWGGEQREALFDIYDLKGVLEEFLDRFSVRGVACLRREKPTELFAESAEIKLGGKILIGELGMVFPPLARRYDLRNPAFLAELDLDRLLKSRKTERKFRPLPQFPAVRRDVAVVAPETVSHAEVLKTIRRASPRNLEEVKLFDIYRGENIPAGSKSMAYALIYRSSEKTLTDEEANAAHQKVIDALRRELRATIRES